MADVTAVTDVTDVKFVMFPSNFTVIHSVEFHVYFSDHTHLSALHMGHAPIILFWKAQLPNMAGADFCETFISSITSSVVVSSTFVQKRNISLYLTECPIVSYISVSMALDPEQLAHLLPPPPDVGVSRCASPVLAQELFGGAPPQTQRAATVAVLA